MKFSKDCRTAPNAAFTCRADEIHSASPRKAWCRSISQAPGAPKRKGVLRENIGDGAGEDTGESAAEMNLDGRLGHFHLALIRQAFKVENGDEREQHRHADNGVCSGR